MCVCITEISLNSISHSSDLLQCNYFIVNAMAYNMYIFQLATGWHWKFVTHIKSTHHHVYNIKN